MQIYIVTKMDTHHREMTGCKPQKQKKEETSIIKVEMLNSVNPSANQPLDNIRKKIKRSDKMYICFGNPKWPWSIFSSGSNTTAPCDDINL